MGVWRLILAWMVIAAHTEGYAELFGVDAGTIAVSNFFFISGFLIPLTYESHYQKNGFLRGCARFFLNRILKIYPIYWASLLVTLGVYGAQHFIHKSNRLAQIDLSTYFQNFLLIGLNQSTFWGGYERLNNPAWTLDVELQYYLLVPLLLFLASSYSTAFKLFIAGFSILSLYLQINPVNLVDFDRSILAWAIFFLFGFIYYKILKKDSMKVMLIFVAFAALVTLITIGLENSKVAAFTYAIVFVFCAVSGVLLKYQMNYRFGNFDRLAGDLSYPTYILHIIFFGLSAKIISFLAVASFNPVPKYAATFLINIFVSTAVGYVALKLIDRPIDRMRSKVRSSEV